LIREPRWTCLPFPSTLLLALALLSGEGCSGEPSSPTSTATGTLSDDEIAELRKSAKSVGELRELMKTKLAQRAGANVTTKSAADSKKRK
jgi:hypothetical protein